MKIVIDNDAQLLLTPSKNRFIRAHNTYFVTSHELILKLHVASETIFSL
jgi:hypothetical protein